ncbi:hypothetical protein ACJ41O_012415 [Fusarium nematophilum]
MYCPSLNVAILSVLAAVASAATHKVEVGKGGLRYTPDSIKADKGDVVEFHFNSMHTVVAGDFEKPCAPAASGGFYSGVLPAGGKSFFSITINSTDPVFFYCSIEGHCQGGMVGVINQGSDTLSAFKSAAENTEKSSSPKAAFGGTAGDGSGSTAGSQSTAESQSTTESQSTATETSPSEASSTETTATAGSTSPTASSVPAAAGQLAGPLAAVTCLALVMAAMLAF